MDVGRDTEIGFLDRDEVEEVGGKRVGVGEICSSGEGHAMCGIRHYHYGSFVVLFYGERRI